MAEANMEPSTTSAHYLLTANELEYLAKLCWLLHDAGTHALRVTFDNIHPPLVLKEHLSQTHIKTVLSKLQQQKLLTEKQWKTLYPPRKRGVTSQKYDSKLLAILLQTICHICPPYPHGWNTLPLAADTSLSADVVRMSILFQQIGSLGGVRDEEYPVLWRQIGEVLLRLGGPPARIKIQRIDNESVPADMQSHYIQLIKDLWVAEEKGMFTANLDALRRRSQASKSAKTKSTREKKMDEEKIPPEDLHVLQKMHKLLTDNVIAEDIMDRLQQGQIIKISDRQEIMALSKNQERMTKILEKIRDSRISYAFKLLCDALKFKYPKEYDLVMTTRKATYKHGLFETIDLVGVCREELGVQYKMAFSRCTPLPWQETLHVCVRDYYTTQDFVDSEGNKLHLNEILPGQGTSGKGRRVVLEGAPGSGQTTLAMMIAHTWANNRDYFKTNYNFMVYIDAQTLGENMRSTVHKTVLPEHSKLTSQHFWSLLEANAKDVVFIVDGFDETVSCPELTRIMKGASFRASALLVLVNPDLRISRYLTADSKIFNLGLNDGGSVRCLRTYAQFVDMSTEACDELVEAVENTSIEWEFTNYLSSPFICLALVVVLKTCKDKSVRDISTVTELIELFGEAMAKGFCVRQNIDVAGSEFPEEIHKTIGQLEQFAFEAACSRRRVFTDEQVIHDTQNIMITKFGALVKSGFTGYWNMTCSLLSDFLSARHLADMALDDLSEVLLEQRFLTRPRNANMISYLCGLFRDDDDTLAPEKIFLELKINNTKLSRKFTAGNSKPVEGDTSSTNQMSSGHVGDYIHSLQGLSECKCRDVLVSEVVKSMPNHLIIRRDGVLPYSSVQGLRAVLRHDDINITHVEINLLPVYMHQPNTYFKLAEALASSPKLRGLRILWYGLELMAQFLVLATKGAKSLKSIQLEDCSKKTAVHVSAVTWANLLECCTNLDTVRKFVFLNCKMASIVCHILHHLPVTLNEVDFAGCAMNPICAGEIATKIEHSRNLRKVNLSSTRLESSDVKALAQGVKLGESLQELNLGGTRLDRSGMVALAESIRLSNSLQCLDLSNSELTTDLCKILAGAIAECRTLTKLSVFHTRITSEGRLYISQAKDSQLQLAGVKTLKYI